MSVESKLKELILKRYNSIREFTQEIDIPYSTIDSILRRIRDIDFLGKFANTVITFKY